MSLVPNHVCMLVGLCGGLVDYILCKYYPKPRAPSNDEKCGKRPFPEKSQVYKLKRARSSLKEKLEFLFHYIAIHD